MPILSQNSCYHKHLENMVSELTRTVKDLSTENAKLKELAYKDSLTDLYNRRFFDQSLSDLWWRGLRISKPLSLMFIDIDDLKKLNTELGHYAADQVIKLICTIIKTEVCQRQSDLVFRYGGDEIIVLLPDTDEEGTNYLKMCIYQALSLTGYSVSIGSSTTIPGGDFTWEKLLGDANEDMFIVKNSKKS